MNRAQLVVSTDDRLSVFDLAIGSAIVGRSASADIAIGSDYLSRLHARLSWDGEQLSIEDLKSTNGTTVNGQLVAGRVSLMDGDRVQFGSVHGEIRLFGHLSSSSHGAQSREGAPVSYSIGYQHAGAISNIGRDQHNISVDHEPELGFVGRVLKTPSLGRSIFFVGLVVTVVGFAGWMYVIFDSGASMRESFDNFDFDNFEAGPPDRGEDPFWREIFGVSAGVLAFGTLFVGNVLTLVGLGIAVASASTRGPSKTGGRR